MNKAVSALQKSIEKYKTVQKRAKETDVSADKDFQRLFSGFYRVRRNAEWKKAYFELFESVKSKPDATFAFILDALYRDTKRVEASFASKMLATVNDSMPIWDKFVLQNLHLKVPSKTGAEKIAAVKETYEKIIAWYQTDEARKYLDRFNEAFPDCGISDVKKTDFALWSDRG